MIMVLALGMSNPVSIIFVHTSTSYFPPINSSKMLFQFQLGAIQRYLLVFLTTIITSFNSNQVQFKDLLPFFCALNYFVSIPIRCNSKPQVKRYWRRCCHVSIPIRCNSKCRFSNQNIRLRWVSIPIRCNSKKQLIIYQNFQKVVSIPIRCNSK